MGLEKYTGGSKTFATIIDGTIRTKSEEGIEGAVKREYETKQKDSSGKPIRAVKWEQIYNSLSGVITRIGFKDSDFGQMLEVEIDNIVLTVNTRSNYGSDLMKKLPEINSTEKVTLKPYSFTDDQGKLKKGITLYQNDQKIPSYFHILDGGKTKAIKGFPLPQGDTKAYKKSDWTIYFLTVEKFLVDFTEKNTIARFTKEIAGTEDALDSAEEVNGDISDDGEIRTDEVPF